jgi:hypothetical protein
VSNAVLDDLVCKAFDAADRFVPALAVTHHTRKLDGLRDPAAVFFAIEVNR